MFTAERISLNLEKPLTKGLWILDILYIILGRDPWGYRCLYKSEVTEPLTGLRNSINLPSCCSNGLISFPD